MAVPNDVKCKNFTAKQRPDLLKAGKYQLAGKVTFYGGDDKLSKCAEQKCLGREKWPYREENTHNSLNRDTSAMNLYKMWLLETAFVERIGAFLCHTIIPLFQRLSCSKTQIGHYRKTPSIG